MKRYYIIILLTVAFWRLNAYSQNTDDTRPMWGIKANLDVNFPGKWHICGDTADWYRHGFGGTVGALYNIYLGHDFYLEPGLSLFYDTYSYKNIEIDAYHSIDPKIYKTGIRVPVVAGYSFNITDIFIMSVYTGPEISYVFSGGIVGQYKNLNNEDLEDTLNPYGKYGLHRRFDCAWKFGLAFPTDYVTFMIDASFGITDICKNDISMRENRLSIGLAHYF